MSKRIPYEELLQREEELTKRNREIWEQTFWLRCEKNKNTSKLRSIRKAKLKYFIEKMNKCLSNTSFTVVKIERLYEKCGCAAVTCTNATVSHYVWFYCKNGCTFDDMMKENVRIEIVKKDLNQFEWYIYPLEVGEKCLTSV